jgi:hypothetical protein
MAEHMDMFVRIPSINTLFSLARADGMEA